MLFRSRKAPPLTFAERLERAREAGFHAAAEAAGVPVSKGECCALVRETDAGEVVIERAGLRWGGGTAVLADYGYQKFLQAPSGERRPALASDLTILHQFLEDLRYALGVASHYHEALGAASSRCLYDGVEQRG